jgi:hypothetical protein
MDEIEQLHAVLILFGALRLQPVRGARELLTLAKGRHRQVLIPGGELGIDLRVYRAEHVSMHRIAPQVGEFVPLWIFRGYQIEVRAA